MCFLIKKRKSVDLSPEEEDEGDYSFYIYCEVCKRLIMNTQWNKHKKHIKKYVQRN